MIDKRKKKMIDLEKKFYADWKANDPEGYKKTVRQERVEEAFLLFALFIYFLIGIGSCIIKVSIWLTENALVPAAKTVWEKIRKADEEFIFGKDLTRH